MGKSVQKLEKQLSNTNNSFLKEQLNENPLVVENHIDKNEIKMVLKNVLSPAEMILAENPRDSNALKEFKIKQFQIVENLLRVELEKITGSEIYKISTSVDAKGMRIIKIKLKTSILLQIKL